MVLAATAVLEDIGGAYPLNSERKPPGDPGRVTYWTKGDFKWNPRFATPASILLAGVETTAYYVIEQLPTPSDPFSDGPSEAFRITVRATGGSSDAVTILQATYTR
jgi:type IV pilus assembly protein PilX